jgi:hypothetical protein
MARKKIAKPPIQLSLVPTPAEVRSVRLKQEDEDELRDLIRQINSKALAKREQKQGREEKRQGEHDPELPPAA